MRGFRALHVSLLAANLLLRAPHLRVRASQLSRQLGHFEHCQRLPALHVVAHIHVNFLDVSRHFRVHIHVLERLELARDSQRVLHGSALYFRHRSGHRITR